MTETARRWLDLAENDKLSAQHLLTLHPMPIEVICYLCEQSAEKNLKGYLCVSENEIPKTHDLMKLNRLCQNQDATFIEIMESCSNLTPYGVQVRYPNNIELSDEDVRLAIEDMEKVSVFVSSKLSEVPFGVS